MVVTVVAQGTDVLNSLFLCRHLLQNSSMTLDTMSDLTRDILELADNDITDKVSTHLSEMTQSPPHLHIHTCEESFTSHMTKQ